MKSIVRFLILFFVSIITISIINYPLKNLAKMTEPKPQTAAVEVNGIRFETRLKKSVIPLPPKEENAMTEVEFEIVVTNNTSNTFYFDFSDNLTPKIMKTNGQTISGSWCSDWVDWPRESHFQLSRPREMFSIIDSFCILYCGGEFLWCFGSRRGTLWHFGAVGTRTYYLEFTYESCSSVLKVEFPDGEDKKIENIWTGKVILPLLKLTLVK